MAVMVASASRSASLVCPACGGASHARSPSQRRRQSASRSAGVRKIRSSASAAASIMRPVPVASTACTASRIRGV
jgi:hypothetical protein